MERSFDGAELLRRAAARLAQDDGFKSYNFPNTFSGTAPRSKAEMVLGCRIKGMRYYMRYEDSFGL